MERAALAAYQADRTAALLQGAEREPISVAERVAAWERWLEHDPTAIEEDPVEAQYRKLLEEVA